MPAKGEATKRFLDVEMDAKLYTKFNDFCKLTEQKRSDLIAGLVYMLMESLSHGDREFYWAFWRTRSIR